MRITASQTYRAQLESMRSRSRESFEAQRTASSGRRLLHPSDDAVGLQRSNLLRAMRADIDVGRGKIANARGELTTADQALGDMTSTLSRLRELSVQMANETLGESERSAAAIEVNQLRSSLISFGNARHGDKRIFSGQMTDTDPFASDGTYQGNSEAVSITLMDVSSVEVTIAGDELLRGASGGPDILTLVEDFSAALAANDTTGIQQAIADLDSSITHITEQRSLVGSRMNLAQRMDTHFDSAEINLVQEIGEIEDADPVEALTDVVRTRTAFEQAMQVSVAARQQNIFALL